MSNDEQFTNETVLSAAEQRGNDSFPVVGVGASAGGLEAFTQLLAALPDNTGMAFVLVQHLDPKHESNLCDILARVARIPVLEASQNLAVWPNHIYVIPPNTTLTIVHGNLQLTARGEARRLHLPIDHFLRSLAAERRTGAIGVILSGTGTDGTLGIEEIKAAGGITFAQDEQSAKYSTMPQSAVRSGCVDLVLSPEEIGRELARIGQHPYVIPSETEDNAPLSAPEEHKPASDDDDFKEILALLHSNFGVDFGGYRDATLKRRIRRRMVLHTHNGLADYVQQLKQNRTELDALYQDVLINVTSFFREPESFEALKGKVFPQIIEGKTSNTPIRIWAPGCSTGQEAYSLAMALLEFLDDKAVKPAIQIFASDLGDTVSLQRAREGIYPENIEAEVSPDRLRRFFTKEDSKYRVNKALRDLCVFAKHNVTTDPPFSRLDLISCRNLLIYLAATLQKRIIPTLHYALNQTGFLMLGASETVGSFTDLFEIVDLKCRIYAKKLTASRQYPYFNATEYSAGRERASVRTPAASPADWQHEADRLALGQYAPPGVLVNESFDVLQFRGETGAFLKPAPGEPSHNLLKMAREGLFVVLRSALNECRQNGATVRRRGVRIRGEGVDRQIDLHVMPVKLPNAGERCFLILFEETVRGASAPEKHVSSDPSKDGNDREADLLRQELASTREYLQSVIEQQDASNEELKSANEEILSGNEELQSTNEELETSKEELESVNEELTTVNEQLQNRNQELSRLGDALTNLQASANIPMVELSFDLRIRRFTPAAAKVLNVVPGDVGRPLDDVRLAVEVPDFKALVTEVIETVQVKEREVRDRNDRWYALRVHPYRTQDNKIDGAVAVFVDIDDAKSAQETLRESRDYAESLIETMRDPFLVLDNELCIVSANQAFYRAFAVTPAETVGRLVYDIGNRQWDVPALRHLLENILPGRTVFQDFEVTHHFERIGHKVMLLDARRIVRHGRETDLILLVIEDVTERTKFRAESAHLAAIVESSGDAIISKTLDSVITSWNQAAVEMFGYAPEEIIGDSIMRLIPPERHGEEEQILARLKAGERIEHFDTERVTKSGQRLPVSLTISPIRDTEGKIIGASKIVRDITERKRLEADLRRSTEQLLEADQRKNEFLAMLAHELRNPLAPLRNGLAILSQIGSHDEVRQPTQEMMERQVEHITRLLDDLLDISRITSGKVELHKERVELEDVIRQGVETCRSMLEAAGQELTLQLPTEPLVLQADPVRLAQIVENLMTNAIKYSEEGGRIELSVEREGSEAVLRMHDHGIGISGGMLPRIWDLFVQAEPQSGRSRLGLGIGLTVVQNLVRLHGGSIEVQSPGLGKGSAFTVRLPLATDGNKTEEKNIASITSSSPPPSRRIMVVDDNSDEAESLGMLLRLMGNEVSVFHDGPAALAATSTFKPEVAFLDVGMPKMDGYELARKLRGNLGELPLLVAVTGYGMAEDRRRSHEAGFDEHLVKPAAPTALQALLAKKK